MVADIAGYSRLMSFDEETVGRREHVGREQLDESIGDRYAANDHADEIHDRPGRSYRRGRRRNSTGWSGWVVTIATGTTGSE